jgi:hypothetical protein
MTAFPRGKIFSEHKNNSLRKPSVCTEERMVKSTVERARDGEKKRTGLMAGRGGSLEVEREERHWRD